VHALAPSLDHIGVFGRTVADAGLVYGALTATDVVDGNTTEAPRSFGLLRGFYIERTEAELVEHIDRIAADLGDAGGWVEQVSLPFSPEALLEASNAILRFEAAAYHRDMFASQAEE